MWQDAPPANARPCSSGLWMAWEVVAVILPSCIHTHQFNVQPHSWPGKGTGGGLR